MSVSTRPLGGPGLCPADAAWNEYPSYDPSDFALGLDLSYLEEAARSSSRRSDERLSRAGKTRKTQEIELVVARRRGQQPGWGSRVGVPRLLARQDELADRRAGIFLPGLPRLRRQAPLRRENLQRLWPVPLRPERTHRLGCIAAPSVLARPPDQSA